MIPISSEALRSRGWRTTPPPPAASPHAIDEYRSTRHRQCVRQRPGRQPRPRSPITAHGPRQERSSLRAARPLRWNEQAGGFPPSRPRLSQTHHGCRVYRNRACRRHAVPNHKTTTPASRSKYLSFLPRLRRLPRQRCAMNLLSLRLPRLTRLRQHRTSQHQRNRRHRQSAPAR